MRHLSFKHILHTMLMVSALNFSTLVYAKAPAEPSPVSIQNAWVRATSAGQEVGAAYMTLTSAQDVDLVKVSSSVTQNVEIHSMVMEKGVMKMRMLESLPLTKNKSYKLAPGGFHLMLFDLKKPLLAGDKVRFELTFEVKANPSKSKQLKAKQVFKQSVTAEVREVVDEEAMHHH